MNIYNLHFYILYFFNFFLLIKSYDLVLSPVSRNVLCYFNINKNCSSEYVINKDKELFFLNNNKNTTTNEHSVLEEHKKDRWMYVDHYVFETEKYFVIPFSIPYENINKVFIFFPNKNFNEEEEISFKTISTAKICFRVFYKSLPKFSCVFLKEDILPLLNNKISLYTILNFQYKNTSSLVFDVILKKTNKANPSFKRYVDKYELPNNFDYSEYLIHEEKKIDKTQESDSTDETSCEKKINLEKCHGETYLIDPCDTNKFYFCFLKNNKITKIKLSCYKDLHFNNIFKFCEKFF